MQLITIKKGGIIMNYIGVDLHKRSSYIYILDKNGNKVLNKRVSNNIIQLKEFFKEVEKPFKLAVETTYNWYFFVDLAQEYSDEVYLANSYELKAFAKRNKKNDKIDAKLIAALLYQGYLPVVYIPDKATRKVRELLRYRMRTVRDRSRVIVRMKSLLDRLGYDSNGNYTTHKKLKEITAGSFEKPYDIIISNYLDRIYYLNKHIKKLEKELEENITKDKRIDYLLSIPGLGYFGSALVLYEIIDIERFKTFNRLCSYAGLAPRVSSSDKKLYYGKLSKNRAKNLQWILLENVYHFIRMVPGKKDRYEQIKKRKNANIAKVALAREMLKIIYKVLKESRYFYYKKDNKVQSAA
jgi:transposase